MVKKRKYTPKYINLILLKVGQTFIYKESSIKISSLLSEMRKIEKRDNKKFSYEYKDHKMYVTRDS